VTIRNRSRRALWNLFTRRAVRERLAQSSVLRTTEHPFAELATHTGDDEVDRRLHAEAQLAHESWCYRHRGDLLIEPRYGYVVDRLHLLDESMPGSERSRERDWRNLIGFPALAPVVAARLGRRAVEHVDAAISLRFLWEDNYFHFLCDVLPRLYVATSCGIPLDVPVVVGRMAERPFFREICPHGTLDGRRVIEQGDRFVRADEVVLIRPPADYESLAFTADLLGAPERPAGTRRLFLTRAPERRRNVSNLEDLLPALDEFGFELVDADDLTVAEQVELFSSAEFISGIHGAGLANMICRRGAPCAVLEIFPPNEAFGYFTHLSARLGFGYDAIAGYALERHFDRRQPFLVEPASFRRKLAAVVARGPLLRPRPAPPIPSGS
jgi:hypothetical protein